MTVAELPLQSAAPVQGTGTQVVWGPGALGSVGAARMRERRRARRGRGGCEIGPNLLDFAGLAGSVRLLLRVLLRVEILGWLWS